jgi:sigma-E factor negative regulatory protein RseA
MSALRKPDTLFQTGPVDDRQLVLSALVDGEAEADEADPCLGALKRDDALRQNWSEYHLIGDLMRGVAPAQDDYMSRFSDRLADEPTILAPRRSVWPQRLAVASFAGLAVWGAISLSGLMSDVASTPNPPLAMAPGFQQVALMSDNDTRVGPYLAAHQEFAPMTVAAPERQAVTVVVEPR